MEEPQAAPGARYVVRTERLTLAVAAPFIALLATSFIAWGWSRLDTLPHWGNLTPPGVAILIGLVAGGMWAYQRRLPLGLLTWAAGAQGAIVLLTTGFIARDPDPLQGLAALGAYALIYATALVLAASLMRHGVSLGMGSVTLFVLTQAMRFPIFEADAEPVLANASLFTLAAAARATVELALLVWLGVRFISSPPEERRRWAIALAVLAAAHGALASWEGLVLLNEFSAAAMAAQAARWLGLVAIQLGLAFAVGRLRRAFAHFEVKEADDAPRDSAAPVAEPPRRKRPARRRRGRR